MIPFIDKDRRLILGSNSPRRRELLAGLGLEFELDARSSFEESPFEGGDAYSLPLKMSEGKSLGFHRPLENDEVLMLAYMNRESLQKTLETGYTWFFSRSRQKLWNKGETSGHKQRVLSVVGDCDDDTLLVTVEQTGPACHTGSHSCFFKPILEEKD